MLTLQFVPYSEIEALKAEARVGKLLEIVRDDKIVLLQGRLRPDEEALLIEQTMASIKDEFRGIEICTIFPEEKDLEPIRRIKKEFFKMLLGNRDGITIIGPSSIIKDIKRDPNKIQLFAEMPKSVGKKNGRNGKTKKVNRRR